MLDLFDGAPASAVYPTVGLYYEAAGGARRSTGSLFMPRTS